MSLTAVLSLVAANCATAQTPTTASPVYLRNRAVDSASFVVPAFQPRMGIGWGGGLAWPGNSFGAGWGGTWYSRPWPTHLDYERVRSRAPWGDYPWLTEEWPVEAELGEPAGP